ncbi:uncharacterized protein A4U43_C04F15470 [Asparagus officinalis]|uniref:Uncharacterized protein n=1 Tax=Asparagus officinalis TaxID=4686 RepID=A0A5P1F5S9_ASPOF|nr:uncharacterized protein A4U43_C04F15470 [Asparagus officinalis]
MELHFPSFPLLFTFLSILILYILTSNHNKEKKKLPPGPWNLPIIGNAHLLAYKPPHRTLRDLATKHGPIMHLKLGQVDFVVVSSPDLAKSVTKTNDINFASRPELLTTKIAGYKTTNLTFAPYGAYWRQLRKICVLHLLSSNRVRSFYSLMEQESANLVKDISTRKSSPVNVTKMVAAMANRVICRAVFSMAREDAEMFLKTAEELIVFASSFRMVDIFPTSKVVDLISVPTVRLIERVRGQMDGMLDRVIREHQEKKKKKKMMGLKEGGGESKDEDLVDVLLRVSESGELEVPITMDNIKATIIVRHVLRRNRHNVIPPGMGNVRAMQESRHHAKMQTRARSSPKQQTQNTRKRPPQPPLPKTSDQGDPAAPPSGRREPCDIDGFHITEGTRVAVNVWAMGRDKGIWGDDAESFRPERFEESSVDFGGGSFEFLPFGAGRRMCPAIGFGLATVEIALAHLVHCFDWEVVDGEELDMREAIRPTLRREEELVLAASASGSAAAWLIN